MSWRAEPQIDGLKPLIASGPDPTLRVAILAAHPDDETIGASAMLARFSEAQVVYLTDGAPRQENLWPPHIRGSREEYAEIRRRESVNALAHAAVNEDRLHWLGAVDQEAMFSAPELACRLADLLAQLRPSVLITHPYEGGHPDHDCAALVARLAVQTVKGAVPLLCEMTSYHAREGRCVTGEFLNSDASQEMVCELTEEDRERKHRMMDEYKSQRLVLENFPIVAERLRVAPEYDFTRRPHEGKLWYECMGWTSWERWRELASRALAQSQECSC